uniref:lipoprotein n=1 Tax=Psychrobacter sp. TaxID=56811 RepID=UPI00159897E0|nr:lipoprotein [Psychrobacter sp.]QJS05681.1 hypothetical protein [Psychrobacter sp.]
MRKLLLGFGLIALLSACSSPDDSVAEVVPDSSIESLESEVSAEPEETAVAVEPAEPEPEPQSEPAEPDLIDDGSIVNSKSSDMDFSICMLQQAEFSEAISSSGNYRVISIVDTNILSIVRFCTNDGSVIHTCNALDKKMVVAMSTNREGC